MKCRNQTSKCLRENEPDPGARTFYSQGRGNMHKNAADLDTELWTVSHMSSLFQSDICAWSHCSCYHDVSISLKPKLAIELVATLLHIRDILAPVLCSEAGYPHLGLSWSSSVTHLGIIPEIRTWPLPSTHFTVPYLVLPLVGHLLTLLLGP
jgi:hypothetical protein